MKTTAGFCAIFLICLSLLGCTRHIHIDKYDVDLNVTRPFKGGAPIQIQVPLDADPNFPVENPGWLAPSHLFNPLMGGNKVFVDLNDVYRNARELIEDVLTRHNVPTSPDAAKYLKFTVRSLKWEVWYGGYAIGVYFDFEIETADGYKRHYIVQDRSASDVARAVGGAVSRAVERMLQDPKVVAYIEAP